MAKIEKHAEFLDTLHGMITKEATAGKVTGIPGKDTNPASVGAEHDKVDKNKEGKPEHNPQEVKQEKGKDGPIHGKSAEEAPAPQVVSNATKDAPKAAEATNTSTQKQAESEPNTKLAQLGQQLLDTINEMNKQANTAGVATGVPGKDTHYASVGSEHDKVNKNNEGKPEHNPQEVKQEQGKAAPITSHGKSAEELDLDKEASFELGRQFARAFLSNKTATESNINKEAGRRDFEALIAQASAELSAEELKGQATHVYNKAKPSDKVEVAHFGKKAEELDEELQVKQAEEAGAQAFYTLVKQAQEDEKANQVKLAFEQQWNELNLAKNAAEKRSMELAAKLAERDAEIQKQAEETKLDAKFASWGNAVVEQVIARLKSEPAK